MNKFLLLLCFCYIYSATFANAAGVASSVNDLTITTIDKIKETATAKEHTFPTDIALIEHTSGAIASDEVLIAIGSKDYVFTATSDKELLQILANSPAAVITDDGAGGYILNFDPSLYPTSSYSLRELGASENAPSEITKYLEGTSSLSPVRFAVEFNDDFGLASGPETLSLYYSWGDDVHGNRTVNPTNDPTNADITFNMKTIYGDDLSAGSNPNPVTKYYKWEINSENERVLVEIASPSSSIEYDFVVSSKDNTRLTSIPANSNVNNSFVGLSQIYNNGAAIYSNWGTIGSITGDFIANSVNKTYGTSYGGAVFNNSGTISSITGDFITNSASLTSTSSSGHSYGGAIYNSRGTITSINDNFIGNYTNVIAATNAFSNGGAIYNSGGAINSIIGDFLNNYTASSTSSSSSAYSIYSTGGAIYNSIGGTIDSIASDFIGNYVTATSNTASIALGGAIYNDSGTIASIVGDFIGNYAIISSSRIGYYPSSVGGGAIHNASTINSIVGNFIGNYAVAIELNRGAGGAINNSVGGTIGSITGDFIDNYTDSNGGAIFNQGNISFITGDFLNNYSHSSYSLTVGGAIFIYTGLINSITGDFIGNHAVNGGAVANQGVIDSIAGDFIGNYASAFSFNNSFGGAIYNSEVVAYNAGIIGSITGDFIGNYTTAVSGNSYGGAIYNNSGTITSIIGNFIDNGKDGAGTTVTEQGAAIYNIIDISPSSITLSDSSFITNAAVQAGAAIYNFADSDDSSVIAAINIYGSTFDGNTAPSGGAIYNTNIMSSGVRKSSTNLLIGDGVGGVRTVFKNNSGQLGGAFYNDSSLGTITIDADFIGNKVNSITGSKGGAVYNTADGIIASISGSFEGNNTLGSDITIGDYGGAIYNLGTISNISATFSNNGANTEYGGAIYNTGTIKINNSSFTNNATDFDSYGGAIYNAGVDASNKAILKITDSSFINNSAQEIDGGGAIYNNEFGEVTIVSSLVDVLVSDNTSGGVDNGIHNLGILNLTAGATSITINDDVTGDGVINIDGIGSVYLNNDLLSSTINFSNGKLILGEDLTTSMSNGSYKGISFDSLITTSGILSTIDGVISTYNLNALDMTNTTLAIDIDLTAELADSFTIAGATKALTEVILINIINPITTESSDVKVNVFNNQATNLDISLSSGAPVDIVNNLQTINLRIDNDVDRGAYFYSVGIIKNDINTAIAMIPTSNISYEGYATQYDMKTIDMGGYGDELIDTSFIRYEEALNPGVYKPKDMRINGLDNGNKGFTVYSDTVKNGGDAILTLVEGSTLSSTNVNWGSDIDKTVSYLDGVANVDIEAANVNFDMQGSGTNSITFGMLNGFNTTTLYSDFTSSDIDNKLIFKDTGTYNLNGDVTDLTMQVNSTVNAYGKISRSIVDVSGILNKFNYDDGNTINLNTNGIIKYDDFKYLYDPTMHDAGLALNSINFNGGTLAISDGAMQTIKLDKITITSNSNLALDVDLENADMDRISANTVIKNANLNINHLILTSDSDDVETEINFTTSSLKDNVNYTGATSIAYSPVYIYNVGYDSASGNFTFTRGEAPKENPQVQAPAIGSLTVATINSELYSKVLPDTSMGAITIEELEEDANVRVLNHPSGDYNQEHNFMWAKAFGADEKLDIENAPKVDAKFTGVIAGITARRVHENFAIDADYNVYTAYTDGHMEFEGNKLYQDGYFIGVGANYYKNNWFTGLTGSVGMVRTENKLSSNSKFNSYLAGIGAKAGVVNNLSNGYSLTTAMFVSYMYTNGNSYNSASGAVVSFDGSHNFELSPELKLTKDLGNGYNVYGKAKYVHSFNDGQHVNANGFILNEVTLKPYVEYGIGYEKIQGTWTGFAEVMRKDFGIQGYDALFGIKICF